MAKPLLSQGGSGQNAVGIRDRIVDFRRVKASALRRNPKNWRLHPEDQRGALQAILADVGMVGAVIARETANGELELLDGHLRADVSGDDEVPVIVVDLNDAEADKILATFDMVSGMAITDDPKLLALLEGFAADIEQYAVFEDNAHLRQLMADQLAELQKEEAKAGKDDEQEREVPGMALQPHEHYDYLVVMAASTHEWNVLCDRLGLVPERRRGRMGTCRAIRAEKLLAKMVGGGDA